MHTEPAILASRSILRISGDDAAHFLQGLLSQDIDKLSESTLHYALLLTPQGKFLHDMFLLHEDGSILIDCEKARLDDLLTRLTRYRLRANVEITDVSSDYAVVVASATATPSDPRLPALGSRTIISSSKVTDFKECDEAEYKTLLLKHGIPNGSQDMQPEQALPLEYGLDKLHAIDFTKGCFVGQEVTARTKHRANLRKGLYTLTLTSGTFPPLGTELTSAGGAKIGTMLTHQGKDGLALLRHEQAISPVEQEAYTMQMSKPDWIKKAL